MGAKGKKEQVTLARSPRWQALLDGDLAVEDLDDDEILSGRLKDASGRLSPKGANQIPRVLHEKMMRELFRRMNGVFAQHAGEAIETILDIMRNGEGEQYSQFEKSGVKRLAAAQYVVERIMGKLDTKTTVTVETTPWQDALESGELLVDIENPPIVDVEVVDDRTTAPARTRAPVRRRRTEE
jgi:hypothetical protein